MSNSGSAVLIINQDFSLAEAIHKILTKGGFRVFYLPDFRHLKARMKKERFSLIIADLTQLESTGERSISQIDWPSLPPMIFLTDYQESNLGTPLSNLIQKSYMIKKPISRDRLLEALKMLKVVHSQTAATEIHSGNGSHSFTKEIKIHGRGGQGVVTAAELVAFAAFEDGKFATAFPSFGSERMGAPVQSFVRISSLPIRDRSQIQTPDVVIIQDPTLIGVIDLTKGLKEDGIVIVDTEKSPTEVGLKFSGTILTVAASKIALGKIGRAIQNTTLVGSLAGATGLISWDSVKKSILKRFPGQMGEKNVASAWEAYQLMEKCHDQKQNLHS
jgi:pyruvate ferredoxin oxidoreductase gamma subunit